jgi:peptidoglycan/LPS O-acetylase OafA/YrhL
MTMKEAPQPLAVTHSRLDSLTGLRFLAALSVFGVHLLASFPGAPLGPLDHVFGQGSVGVSFFFILSGFVLTWSHRASDTKGLFWRRRFARIYPLTFFTWFGTGLILWAFHELPTKGPAVASALLLSPWIPKTTYLEAMDASVWSLGCEAFFYFLFPFILALLVRQGLRNRRLLLGLSILAVVAVAAVLHHAQPGTTRFWFLYYFPPVRLAEFVCGMLLAIEVGHGTWFKIPTFLAVALALGAYAGSSWAPPAFAIVSVTLVPFILLIGAMGSIDIAQKRSFLRSRAMVRLGMWSFAFYLVHGPVLEVFAHFEPIYQGVGGAIGTGFATLAASVLVAALCYHFVERPLEQIIRQPKLKIPIGVGIAVGVFVVGAIATMGYAIIHAENARPVAPGGGFFGPGSSVGVVSKHTERA